ncbi:MAG: hypothetical protein AAF633_12150 [Chloroflexota bacterium]
MLRRVKRAIHISTLIVCMSGFSAFAGGKASEVSSPVVNQPIVEVVVDWVENGSEKFGESLEKYDSMIAGVSNFFSIN